MARFVLFLLASPLCRIDARRFGRVAPVSADGKCGTLLSDPQPLHAHANELQFVGMHSLDAKLGLDVARLRERLAGKALEALAGICEERAELDLGAIGDRGARSGEPPALLSEQIAPRGVLVIHTGALCVLERAEFLRPGDLVHGELVAAEGEDVKDKQLELHAVGASRA
ncbi:hypothetical protein L1887_57501 [Cichorium endivia]|nr:hypothetical protein L1887_57501 [Cichorium endivia]